VANQKVEAVLVGHVHGVGFLEGEWVGE